MSEAQPATDDKIKFGSYSSIDSVEVEKGEEQIVTIQFDSKHQIEILIDESNRDVRIKHWIPELDRGEIYNWDDSSYEVETIEFDALGLGEE